MTATSHRPSASRAILRTIAQRLGLGVFTLFVVSLVIFSLISLLPGNFATSILGQSATPETVAAFEREVGLDIPPVTRYIAWVKGVAQGDFGNSFVTNGTEKRPVQRSSRRS